MSADNGVYILITWRCKGKRCKGKKEYRVARAECIDNLTDNPDYPPHRAVQINLDATLSIFGKSRVFTDRKLAEGYAVALLDRQCENGGVCEYGIVRLNYPTIQFPKSQHRKLPEDADRVLDELSLANAGWLVGKED